MTQVSLDYTETPPQEKKKASSPQWEAGMKKHQTLRNEARQLLFNWKTGTTFNTSPASLPAPRLPFAPAQGVERTLGDLGSGTQPRAN